MPVLDFCFLTAAGPYFEASRSLITADVRATINVPRKGLNVLLKFR